MELTYGELFDVMRKIRDDNKLILSWTSGYCGWDFTDEEAERFNQLLLNRLNFALKEKGELSRGKKQRRVV